MHSANVPAPISHALVESHDFDEIASALPGLEVRCLQLSGGVFRGEVERVVIPPFVILRTAVNRIVQVRGNVRANTTLFSLITEENERANWRGERRRRGEINLNHPSSEIDHLTSRNYANVSILVDTERFREAGQTLLGLDVVNLLRGVQGWHAAERPFASLQRLVEKLLAEVRINPEGPNRFPERSLVTEQLMLALGASLADNHQRSTRRAPSAKRKVLAQRAEEYMAAHLREAVLMTDLCKELDVSERTLRYAFQDHFGVSPLAYFRRHKLNAIRQELKKANLTSPGVQVLARQWGVIHLGNFAADYRRLFGELPSETARQRVASPGTDRNA